MRKTTLLWLLLAVFCSAILFHTSQQVTDGKARLASLQNKTQDEEESIRVLQAEWSYLNQPARLEKLVKEYLALEPMQGRQFAKLADIPEKEPEAVVPEEIVTAAGTTEAVEEKPAVAVAPKPAVVSPIIAKPVIAKPAPVVAKVVAKTVTKTVAVKAPAPVIKIQKPVETPIVAGNLPKTLIPVAAVPPKQAPVTKQEIGTKQAAAAKPTETRTKFTNSTQRKFGDVMQSLGLE